MLLKSRSNSYRPSNAKCWHQLPHRKLQAGITLIEISVSLAILSATIAGAAVLTSRFTEDTRLSIAADQVSIFADASNRYIRDNFDTVIATATTTSPFLLNTAELIAGDYLPPGYNAINSYQQNICTLALDDGTGQIQAITITEGGAELRDGQLARMASYMGARAGAIYADSDTEITGLSGVWSIPIGNFANANHLGETCSGATGSVALEAGRTAIALWLSQDNNLADDFLHRDAIPGRPELNQMNTDIDLNDNRILNAQSILFNPALFVTEGDTCAAADEGDLRMTSDPGLVVCNGTEYESVSGAGGSLFWLDPHTNLAALQASSPCAPALDGAASMLTNTGAGRPVIYTCDGSSWVAATIDTSGSLVIPGDLTVEGLSTFQDDIIVENSSIDVQGGVIKANDFLIEDVRIDGSMALLSRAVYDAIIVNSGDVINKPSCPSGQSAQIFVSADSFPVGGRMTVDTLPDPALTTTVPISGEVLRFRTSGPTAVVEGVSNDWRVFGEAFILEPPDLDGNQEPGEWHRLGPNDATLSVITKCT